MPRSSRWRSGSRSAPRSAEQPWHRNAPLVEDLRAVPDPTSRLGDGVLVRARIRARLFGAPILRLDAEVVLVPATMDAANPVPADGVGAVRPSTAPLGLDLARATSLIQQSRAKLS